MGSVSAWANKYYTPLEKSARFGDVSQRMLRYYEEVGLIVPDKIAEPSHYRYYSVQTMRRIQAVRYLIDEGFRLEEIRSMLCSDDLDRFRTCFLKKSTRHSRKLSITISGWTV